MGIAEAFVVDVKVEGGLRRARFGCHSGRGLRRLSRLTEFVTRLTRVSSRVSKYKSITDDIERLCCCNTSAALTSSTFLTTASTMSLPRSNYDPRRVCINPFPAITLGKHRRTIGIYLAGGLVRLFCLDVPYVI